MTDTTSEEASNSTGKIEFLDHHYPPLEDGDYKITFQQELQKSATADARIPYSQYSLTRRFAVAGERFQLQSEIIHSVFPPDGSLGDYSNVLPHLMLNRSTLPWERRALESARELPWLALLLFTEAEIAEEKSLTPQVITLRELMNSSASGVIFPPFTLQSGQHEDDQVTVIDVPKALLNAIMPAKAELQFMAHVRQTKDADDQLEGEERAVIIGNRLPVKGASSTVHLVSIEDRLTDEGFTWQGGDESQKVRLVSLKSWSFACTDKQQSFLGLLTNLNRDPATLRLPDSDSAEANTYLQMGYTLLPHHLRQGEKTASWYHGPLSTGENTAAAALPARAADELVRYNAATGLFDVSYAAAWELGRLLALQSKQFSIDLYNWKRGHAQQVKQAEQQLLYSNLASQSQPNTTIELPEQVSEWFENLSLLKGTPFNYLVPDERMLPKESIRFFQVDGLWIDCLLDGAYSIGRVTSSDYEMDQAHEESPASSRYKKLSGFLLRSAVVSGWPDLLADGYDAESAALEQVRMDRLSENVLLCLFEGEVFRVEIHQKPETLHFGLDGESGSFHKILKDEDGVEDRSLDLQPVPWRDESRQVLDIASMANGIQAVSKLVPFTSAEFALQMIEGVEKVQFLRRRD